MNPIYYYLAVNIFTFLVYLVDKRSAEKGWNRVPERTLHIFSLGGGFVGALFGRKCFRHKTRKPEFLVMPVIAAIIHFTIWVLHFQQS